MGTLREDRELRDRKFVFVDRDDAGKQLAKMLGTWGGSSALVLAIPSGGVPVGARIAEELGLVLDLLIVRKLQIPFSPEAGFGAMTQDGDVILNEELMNAVGLGPSDISAATETTRNVLARRNALFRGNRPLPDFRGMSVIITDDGLASGYTMRAAVRLLKRHGPEKTVIAVPTGSLRTVEALRAEVDELVCLNVRTGGSFAVADAYRHWYDIGDEEVLAILRGYGHPK